MSTSRPSAGRLRLSYERRQLILDGVLHVRLVWLCSSVITICLTSTCVMADTKEESLSTEACWPGIYLEGPQDWSWSGRSTMSHPVQ